MKDSPLRLFYHGKSLNAVHHCRLRVGCSALNYDLFNNLHVAESPSCHCGFHSETAAHFLLDCPLFANQRVHLYQQVSVIKNDGMCINSLLYGDDTLDVEDNCGIFDAVHSFI